MKSDHDIGHNPVPGLVQAQKGVGIKPANGILTSPLHSRLLDSQRKYIYEQTIKNLHIFASTQT